MFAQDRFLWQVGSSRKKEKLRKAHIHQELKPTNWISRPLQQVDRRKMGKTLVEETVVGKVWGLALSKFSDTNTNAQHVTTCWTSSKSANFYGKRKHTSKHVIIFLYHIFLLSQRIQKCNKNWKVPSFFSLCHHLVYPTYEDSPKIDVMTNDKCWQNFTTLGQHHKKYLDYSQLRKNNCQTRETNQCQIKAKAWLKTNLQVGKKLWLAQQDYWFLQSTGAKTTVQKGRLYIKILKTFH